MNTSTYYKIITLLLLSYCSLSWAEQRTDLYQPSHKTPQTLISTIKPLFESLKLSIDNQYVLMHGDTQTIDRAQELLTLLDHPAKRYHVTISSTIPNQKTLSYQTLHRQFIQQSFDLVENTPLILSKKSSSQQAHQNVALSHQTLARQTQNHQLVRSWHSVSTQQAYQGESLTLLVQGTQEYVYLYVKLSQGYNNNQQNIEQHVSGGIGEWMTIGATKAQTHKGQRWETNKKADKPVFIKVDLAN